MHTEICNNSCLGAGYLIDGPKKTNVITYGTSKENIIEGELQSGDAFDCDVNGDKKYDKDTERFYYVSDLYDSTIEGEDKYNHDVAVLVYYNNTVNGLPNNMITDAYDSTHGDNVSENWHGPLTALKHLPTIEDEQWSNVDLINTSKQIFNEVGGITTKNTDGSLNELPVFSYEGYVARFLTTQELEKGCDIKVKVGSVPKCEYMFENTQFANSSLTYGFWLETPFADFYEPIWFVSGRGRMMDGAYVYDNNNIGVRPAIEVLKTNIDY